MKQQRQRQRSLPPVSSVSFGGWLFCLTNVKVLPALSHSLDPFHEKKGKARWGRTGACKELHRNLKSSSLSSLVYVSDFAFLLSSLLSLLSLARTRTPAHLPHQRPFLYRALSLFFVHPVYHYFCRSLWKGSRSPLPLSTPISSFSFVFFIAVFALLFFLDRSPLLLSSVSSLSFFSFLFSLNSSACSF